MAKGIHDLPALSDVPAFDPRQGAVQGAQDDSVAGAARMEAGVAQQFQQGFLMPVAGLDCGGALGTSGLATCRRADRISVQIANSTSSRNAR